jgi:uncharacterized membrane protein required for colicin V production
MPAYNYIDLILTGLFAFGILRGVRHGLSGELAGLSGLAAGLAAGWYYHGPLGAYLAETTRLDGTEALLASFILVLFGGLLLMAGVSLLLRQVMELTFKGPLEYVGGGLAGGARYAVLLAIVVLAVSRLAPEATRRPVQQDSVIARQALALLNPWYDGLVDTYPDLPIELPPASDPADGEESAPRPD